MCWAEVAGLVEVGAQAVAMAERVAVAATLGDWVAVLVRVEAEETEAVNMERAAKAEVKEELGAVWVKLGARAQVEEEGQEVMVQVDSAVAGAVYWLANRSQGSRTMTT